MERGLAANTLTSYRRDLQRYVSFLGGREIDDVGAITSANISEFLMALREGGDEHPPLTAGSAARTLVAVRGFHKFVVREGLLDTDPDRVVRPPSPTQRLPKALPLSDI